MVTNNILAFKQQLVAAIHKYRYKKPTCSRRNGESRFKIKMHFRIEVVFKAVVRMGWGAGGVWHCTSATFHDVVFALGAKVTSQRFMPRDSAHL